MTKTFENETISVYRLKGSQTVRTFIVSTPETRRISNDPCCLGLDYTHALSNACGRVLKVLQPELELIERSATVVNILRGGLNYGLREALGAAFHWTAPVTCFLSAQRTRDAEGDGWHIIENAYRKLRFPQQTSLVMGDVVATGTSLDYALETLIDAGQKEGVSFRQLIFFTYGGPKAQEVLLSADERCHRLFSEYKGTTLIYLEGIFAVPDETTPLSIKLTGTDLVRREALLSPAFIMSQYEDPAYPLERCAIYDAGSRAFAPDEYLEDVLDYWRQTKALAQSGITYAQLLAERFPLLEADRFGSVDLNELCDRQMRRLSLNRVGA